MFVGHSLMLQQIRKSIIESLWQTYCSKTPDIYRIEMALKKKNNSALILDHFAIIDLPGPETGIAQLSQLFSAIGYLPQGRDYLPDKQNEFLWMTELNSITQNAKVVLPQVVLADFRLNELPTEIRHIIEKYGRLSPPAPITIIQQLAGKAYLNDESAASKLIAIILNYLKGRDWPLPTKREFELVKTYNPLLAWVLIFGRQPNHFTLSVHLMNHFSNLTTFNDFIRNEVGLSLNQEGGEIKGSESVGIAQSSTIDTPQTISLEDGNITLPGNFIEFVWRYPRNKTIQKPIQWKDFFTGFIGQQATRVIESLGSN